ncbi:MAG: tetratricopeptide repeat protein [Nitrospirae bacterium]|nr:tetratricopeptide repeat protein [Nitrospirota bacterium]
MVILTRPLPVLLLLSFISTLIYSNTFSASFHFDDNPNIVENLRIREPGNFLDFSGTRYVGFLSFALNYHVNGLDVFGYHFVNLLIHTINGFLVYLLVLLLLQSGFHSRPFFQDITASWIALATALLFVSHPVQTQAVTYIVQRFASLAALFYLLTVVCYLKWRLAPMESKSRYLWYAMGLISTALAMKTKENSLTLPLMILLMEAIFFRPFTRRRWLTLVPFLLTLLIIPLSRVDVHGDTEVRLTQQTTEISRFDYLLTQFRVIVTYIRLLILPINQNLDYDYPIYHSLLELPVLLSLLFLLSLFILSLHLLFNSKFKAPDSQLISFGLLWFFLTLSIESSIIPIRDLIFEHRLYLPSVGFFLSLTTTVSHRTASVPHRAFRLFLVPSFTLILLILSVATYQRNLVWKDEVSLWEDVVRKSPEKARAHNNLGLTYYEQPQRLEDAVQEYQIALKIKPDYVQAQYNLGLAFFRQGRWEDAAQAYGTALKLKPDFADAHNDLGAAYRKLGRPEEANQEYRTALELKPDFASAHNNLGVTYKDLGRLEDAIREFQVAIKLQPNRAEVHYNLGDAYGRKGQVKEAIHAFKQALEIKPDFLAARKALDFLYQYNTTFP